MTEPLECFLADDFRSQTNHVVRKYKKKVVLLLYIMDFKSAILFSECKDKLD